MDSKTRARPDERMALMMLNTVLNSIDNAVLPLMNRLANDKYISRGLKAARTNIGKAVNAAAQTIEPESLNYIVKNSEDYEIIIRQRHAVKDPSWIYVKTDDLQAVVEKATQNECGICLLTGGEIAQCKTRKALANMVDEPITAYGCGFREGKINGSK